MGIEGFLERLRVAFPAERIDGRAAFAQWGGSYLDADDYANAIDGKTWAQLDEKYVVKRNDALGFLSTRELVQLLPVYLRSLADHGFASPAFDAMMVKLTKPTREPSRSRFEALTAALDAQQREVIATALRDLANQDPDSSPGQAAKAALISWEGEDSGCNSIPYSDYQSTCQSQQAPVHEWCDGDRGPI